MGFGALPTTTYTFGTQSANACDEWLTDKFTGLAYSKVVAVSISVVNTILRTILILLVKFIGEDTKSEQTRSVKVAVFITQFFNTAILLLLFNANMSETSIPFFSDVLTGEYTDFHEEWYSDIGCTILKAMIVAAVFPVIEFCMFGAMKYAFKLLDRGFSSNMFVSKKKTVQQYVDVQVGPEYMIHFRYSGILNTAFVAMMYGVGLPLLFPISLFSFVVLYLVERYCIFYYYKQPPMFDDAMTRNSLRILNWAPLLYCVFGYWMLGNNQIFSNLGFPLTHSTDFIKSGHTIISDVQRIAWDQSLPLLVLGLILMIGLPLGSITAFLLQQVGIGEIDIKIDEDLANYFDACEREDREDNVKEEQNLRATYNVKLQNDDGLLKYQQAKDVPNTIQGVHSYAVLYNPDYIQAIQYVPASIPNREALIRDGDDIEGNDTA